MVRRVTFVVGTSGTFSPAETLRRHVYAVLHIAYKEAL